MKKRSELVNFLKGISITGVVLYHLIASYLDVPNILKTASNFGGAGVHIFFICSGFGLAVSHTSKPTSWSIFMKKRFLKVYLPYIFVVLISFFIPFMYSGEDRLTALLSHIFLFKMIIPGYEYSFGMQLWFVATIFEFYFVFLFLMYLKEKIGTRKFFLVSCVLSVIWIIFTVATGINEQRVWGSFFLQYLWEFSLGVCIAEQYVNGKLELDQPTSLLKTLIVAGFSISIFMYTGIVGGMLKNINDIFSVGAFGGSCLLLYRIMPIRQLFKWICKFSYELYLVHILIFEICFRALSSFLPNLMIGIISIIASILCAVMYQKIIAVFFRKLPQ